MIEGYVDRESVTAGEVLDLRVSTDAEEFRVRFYRLGRELEYLGESEPRRGVFKAPPAHPDGVAGHAAPDVDWELPHFAFPVPEQWRPGVYLAHLVEGDERRSAGVPLLGDGDVEGFSREFFVVRPRQPGRHGRVLYKKSTFTRHAYNRSDGEGLPRDSSLYDSPVHQEGDAHRQRGHKVSLHRPGGVIDLAHWDAPFIAWLERCGYAVEYCTDLDLHEDPELLSSYDLLLSVGHDEYWSAAMRDHVAAHLAGGGNVAFLSANTCWWRIHVTDGGTAFVSDTDHHVDGVYPHLPATDLWWAAPPDGVGRPENAMTGVSFRNGGMWPGDWPGDRPTEGYTVQHADHWVFEGTGLRDGRDGSPADRLGAGTALIGYECDGAAFVRDEHGVARASGVDGTPDSFLILGIYLLDPVNDDLHRFKWSHWNCPEREPAITSPRAATMGVHTTEGGGTVFTAGTVDWPVVCGREEDAGVVRVTRNVIDRLSRRGPDLGPAPVRKGT
ncbi:N,N-dimethylformamidase beta subunit family domain-containing protein [Streptomyces sp. NPDC049906]|uniref:N,N-dimethylformamidase beta subunit family domain-containing protein n=1 Tax=Streptomyces sp. NPDC049906 TaxID=3155656 RepID=UPI0034326A7C